MEVEVNMLIYFIFSVNTISIIMMRTVEKIKTNLITPPHLTVADLRESGQNLTFGMLMIRGCLRSLMVLLYFSA